MKRKGDILWWKNEEWRGWEEGWEVSAFERKILDKSPDLNRAIKRWEQNEEKGEWKLDGSSLKIITAGGEAVLLEEEIGGLKVAVKVQCFDPALFTHGMDGYETEMHSAECGLRVNLI